MECDVAIIGAGVAGLSAAAILKQAGKDVLCLEATDRIGGRILTVHDPSAPIPVELGAEFIHGRPREILDTLRAADLTACEHSAATLHIDGERVLQQKEVGELADHLLSRMEKPDRKDESFEDYLHRSRQPASLKAWARLHVEGFNAARSELISVASLKQDTQAANKIDGNRSFLVMGGYDQLVLALLRSIPDGDSIIEVNSVVGQVKWRPGRVEVHYRSRLDDRPNVLRCRQLMVTVPLGVLQSGAIQFDPEPGRHLHAASSLQFGQVYRVTFRFREAFWEDDEKLKQIGFLVSREKYFPTWWTTHPIMSPMLTGWMAGTAAEDFHPRDSSQTVAGALSSLSRILGRKIPSPEEVYFHNWRCDPFFRGAYSYVPAGALHARRILAEPVEDTLFFAGEATELRGHGSTVHGAIASGSRAAHLMLSHLAIRGAAS